MKRRGPRSGKEVEARKWGAETGDQVTEAEITGFREDE